MIKVEIPPPHPQVTAVLRGAHILRPAPDLNDAERKLIEFSRELDRYRAGLPHGLTDQQIATVDLASAEMAEVCEEIGARVEPLTIDDLDQIPTIVADTLREYDMSSSLIDRVGWDWLHDALAR